MPEMFYTLQSSRDIGCDRSITCFCTCVFSHHLVMGPCRCGKKTNINPHIL